MIRFNTILVTVFIGVLGGSVLSCDLSIPSPKTFDVEAQYKKDSQAIEDYLAKYNIQGVQTTESGLKYKIVEEGTGPAPNTNDIVSMHFTVSLMDSAVIETTIEEVAVKYNIYDTTIAYVPYKFNFGQGFSFSGIVLQGLREGSQMMKLNDRYVFYLPSKLGFGQNSYGKISGNTPTVWDMKMVQIR